MKKSPIVLFAFVALVVLVVPFLTACIKIDLTQTVDNTGLAHFAITYDFSGMAAMMQDATRGLDEEFGMASSSSSLPTSWTDEFTCDSVLQQMDESPDQPLQGVKNISCVNKGSNVVQLSFDYKLSRRDFIKRKGLNKTIYMLRLGSAAKFTDMQEQSAKEPTPEELEMTKNIIQVSFTISMPGRIVKTPVGKIVNNTVVITTDDVIPKNTRGFIRSEE